MDVDRELEAWRPFALALTRGYFIAGGDRDDVEQEAMLGLLAAIRGYDPDRGASFQNFAALVIRRRLQTAVRLALTLRHAPLNQSRRGAYVVEDELVDLVELEHDRRADVAELVEQRLELRELVDMAEHGLTALESQALAGVRAGRTYADIAAELDVDVKAIDNALVRVNLKARRRLLELAA